MAWLQSLLDGVKLSITDEFLTIMDVIVDSETIVEFIGTAALGLGHPLHLCFCSGFEATEVEILLIPLFHWRIIDQWH